MKTVLHWAGAFAPVALILSTACTSVLGVTDPPSATCGGSTASNDCDSCLNVVCCSEETTCLGNAACTSIVDCVAACPTGSGFTTCLDTCGTDNPSGVDDYNAVISCADACDSPCSSATTTSSSSGSSSGGASSCGISWNTTDCNACMNTSCCSQSEACADDSTCESVLTCLTSCPSGNATCTDDCVSSTPSTYDNLFACFSGPCSTACSD